MGCQNEESFGKLLNSIASNKNPQNEGVLFVSTKIHSILFIVYCSNNM